MLTADSATAYVRTDLPTKTRPDLSGHSRTVARVHFSQFATRLVFTW